MNIHAKAGKMILTNKHNEYRLNLLQCDDNSPVIILAQITGA